MSIETRIVCDRCKCYHHEYGISWGPRRKAVHLLRATLKKKLLWKVGMRDGEDLCYHCVREEKENPPDEAYHSYSTVLLSWRRVDLSQVSMELSGLLR